MLTALGLGALVGLGIAMPLGAIAVLILETGISRGWRRAAAAGLGAASVDLAYATLAMAAGAAVSSALSGHERALRIGGAVVLAVVATLGLVGLLRRRRAAVDLPETPQPATVRSTRPASYYLRFVALTAVNPLTVVYFAAVVAALTDTITTAGTRVAFVLGIGVASAAWQLGLAAIGAGLGARVRPAVRTLLAVVGYAVVGGFAVAMLL